MSKTEAKRIKATIRRAFVLELRKSGKSYREIAAETINKFGAAKLPNGYDERYAWFDVDTELKRLNSEMSDNAKEVRRLELERLDVLQDTLWPLAIGGNLAAIDRILRIAQRRAELLGLDAPTKIAPTDPTGDNPYLAMTDEQRQEALLAILNNSNKRPSSS